MYYVCDFLQLRRQLIHSLGTLQFDNQEAERIINDIERAIIDTIKKGFDEIKFSKLSCLVDNNTPYHKFHEKINENENKGLFEKFKILLENDEIRMNLKYNCKFYSELIMLELGHIYKLWYNEEPKFSLLSKEVRTMLEKYPNYYNRIKKFGTCDDS